MKYKYRSVNRFSLLLEIDGELVQVRPNQVIESESKLSYDTLKEIKPPKPKKRKVKESGNDNTTNSDGVRELIDQSSKQPVKRTRTRKRRTGHRQPKQD